MRRPLVAGNWKMHGSRAFIERYASELRARCPLAGVDLLLLPPACYLHLLAEQLVGLDVALGAQNVHWQESGPFTGEIAPQMVREMGAVWTLVGHSERRAASGETDQAVADKCGAALAAGVRPIVCVGESLAEREAGSAEAVVLRQIDAIVRRSDAEALRSICFAYEPIWAIGSGRTASPAQAQVMHALIRERLGADVGRVADEVRILYGGSVTPENASALFEQPDIDGALVGGASLAPQKLLQIAAAAVAVEQLRE